MGGRSLLTGGRLVFDCPAPSAGLAQELHGFSWLRHFNVTKSRCLRDNARMLLRLSIKRPNDLPPEVDLPSTRAERVISIITNANLLMRKARLQLFYTPLWIIWRAMRRFADRRAANA